MPAQLYRVRWEWNIGSGAEIAANSWWFLNPTGDGLAATVARVNTTTTAFSTALFARMANDTTMRRIRVDEVDITNGRNIMGADATLPAGNGSNGTASLPLQTSPVVTLRTGLSGGSHRGRIFLPPLAQAVATGAQSRLTSSVCTSLVNATKVMLDAMKGVGTQWFPVVYSRTGHSTVTITQVEVGDVLDTQRSRRNRLAEARTSAVLA